MHQLRDSAERGAETLGRVDDVGPELPEFRDLGHVLEHADQIPADDHNVAEPVAHETHDELDLLLQELLNVEMVLYDPG